MGKSRSELMDEIARIDSRINELLSQMPAPPRVKVVPFPWGMWIVTVLLIGSATFNSGALLRTIHEGLYDQKVLILIIGSVVALFALVQTFRSVSHLGGQGGKYKHLNKKVDQLRKERGFLAQKLNEIGRT